MAHELNIVNGKASMFSAIETPWHGLGQIVDKAPNSADAIKLAGLDWNVNQFPLTSQIDGETINTPMFGNFRSDNKAFLGAVRSRYQVVQNVEAFDFLDSLHQDGILKYETAGALGAGERVFMTAQIPGDWKVADSAIKMYLLLFTSHDGSSGIEVLPTTVRVVCNNTLSMARNGAKNVLKFRHTSNIQQQMKMASTLMEMTSHNIDTWITGCNKLVERNVSRNDIKEMLDVIYPNPNTDGIAQSRYEEKLIEFWHIYNSEATQQNIKGTAWGMVNAVTYLEDHYDGYIFKGNKAESKFDRTVRGEGAKTKTLAYNMALQLAGA